MGESEQSEALGNSGMVLGTDVPVPGLHCQEASFKAWAWARAREDSRARWQREEHLTQVNTAQLHRPVGDEPKGSQL